MLAFVAPRLVLLSIPKTGTTALEAALAPKAEMVLRSRPEIKHLTMSQYNLRIEPLLRFRAEAEASLIEGVDPEDLAATRRVLATMTRNADRLRQP